MFIMEQMSYVLRKKPASERHFTLVPIGNRARKLSQCISEANPPAEHPDKTACHSFINAFRPLLRI